jgi:hypothetical protein
MGLAAGLCLLVVTITAAVAVALARPATGESATELPEGPSLVAAAQQVEGPKVLKDPAAANLFLGDDEIIIVERVSSVPAGPGLGSYQLRVAFDRDVVSVQIADGPFLRSTGRTPFCLNASGEGFVVLSCFTIGNAPGPAGEGILAVLTVRPADGLRLRAVANNGIETLIDDISGAVRLGDAGGQTIPVASAGDSSIAVRALEGDINDDCRVDVADSQIIAGRLGVVSGMAAYSPFFDLEPAGTPDGDTDISDLQVVFGRHGSTCAAPIPEQHPPGGPPPTATGPNPASPTASRTPTATPTSCPDHDVDGICNNVDPDDDNDGCTDVAEQQTAPGSQATGGLRDPYKFWDFYDPSRNRVVSGVDFFSVLERFGAIGNPSIDPLSEPPPGPWYHSRFDRRGSKGPHPWSLRSPDGAIAGIDFVSVLGQFGHDCSSGWG